METKTKVVDLFYKKTWYDVKAPAVFNIEILEKH
jgi:ribosomal protein S3AE